MFTAAHRFMYYAYMYLLTSVFISMCVFFLVQKQYFMEKAKQLVLHFYKANPTTCTRQEEIPTVDSSPHIKSCFQQYAFRTATRRSTLWTELSLHCVVAVWYATLTPSNYLSTENKPVSLALKINSSH